SQITTSAVARALSCTQGGKTQIHGIRLHDEAISEIESLSVPAARKTSRTSELSPRTVHSTRIQSRNAARFSDSLPSIAGASNRTVSGPAFANSISHFRSGTDSNRVCSTGCGIKNTFAAFTP